MIADDELALRTILILDTETTGTGPDDVAIEVGCILFSVKYAATIECYSALIFNDVNPAESVNRVPVGLLQAYGHQYGGHDPWAAVEDLASRADAIVAHNAEFDKRYVPAAATLGLPWICSANDLAWPASGLKPGASLVNTVLAHGLGVAAAHRALADCEMVARLLTHVSTVQPLEPFLARGLRQKATFRAIVSYDDRAIATAHGFRWFPDVKQWRRTMAIEDTAALPFKTATV